MTKAVRHRFDPGLYTDDVDDLASGPGERAHDAPYGLRERELEDPDGNRLRIGSPVAS